jgi:cytochrome b561
MPLRNRPEGYGLVTRTLHWVTVAALAAQFAVGYAMDWDDGSGGRGRGRGRGDGSGRGRGGDDAGGFAPDLGNDPLVTLHVVLGLTIIALALGRWTWRRIDSLPAWAEQLTERDKRLAHVTERALLALLVLVPATGIVLLVSGDDDLLWLHVAAHVAFFAALAAHVGLVLRRRLLPRMLARTASRREEPARG